MGRDRGRSDPPDGRRSVSEYREILAELEGARLEPSRGRWIPARRAWRARLADALRRIIEGGRR